MDKSIAAHQEMIDALGGNSVKRFRELVVTHINEAATGLRGYALTELLFPLGGRRAWAVWLTAVFTYLVTVLHRGSMSVAGLQAAERFGISASALASFTVVQLTVYAAMQVPVGVLLDRYGSKRLLIAASCCCSERSLRSVWSTPTRLPSPHVRYWVSVTRWCSSACCGSSMSWFPALRQPVMSQATGMLGGVGAIISTVPMAAAFRSSAGPARSLAPVCSVC